MYTVDSLAPKLSPFEIEIPSETLNGINHQVLIEFRQN